MAVSPWRSHTPSSRRRNTGSWGIQLAWVGLSTDPMAATATALREVAEETGIAASADALIDWRLGNRFPILPPWQGKFAPGVSHNIEHVFSLPVPAIVPVRLAPDEHTAARWLPWQEAVEAVFSWTNRDAIRLVARTLSATRLPVAPRSSS